MGKLSIVVRYFQSWKATNSVDVQRQIINMLSPLTSNTGVSNLTLTEANQHQVKLSARYHNVQWVVRLIPTFHGVQVMVDGRDRNGAKKEIAAIFKQHYLEG